MPQTALIIGAGPAGLTAALELCRQSQVRPVVLEASHEIGGLSRTVRYQGNRMDIGGHRFFSKSERVMQWWLDLLPLAEAPGEGAALHYHRQTTPLAAAAPVAESGSDRVMLLRPRKSRIYYDRKFFDYPLAFTPQLVWNLGLGRTAKIAASYQMAKLFPRRPESTLEDFFINRFGRQLYSTFFRDYTEKVWGLPCDQISAEWGAQRIKGLSLARAIRHFMGKIFRGPGMDYRQSQTETSLIEQFLYPKYGPGQLWEYAAELIRAAGGDIILGQQVTGLRCEGGQVRAVESRDESGQIHHYAADYVISTMPVQDLLRALRPAPPAEILNLGAGLVYRDFITIGLLARQLKQTEADGRPLQDNWIYIQEPEVKIGRLQIFNNWSPYMVADPATTWLGLEYFCNAGDPLWQMPDADLRRLGARELAQIGLLDEAMVLDGCVVRVPKTYPAYFGTYQHFAQIRQWLDPLQNLYLTGRNGMHRYNNQDHSMLTAMAAVDNIVSGQTGKDHIWATNTEPEYHEVKSRGQSA